MDASDNRRKRGVRDLESLLQLARDLSGFPEQEKMEWSLGESYRIRVSVEGKEPIQTPKQNAEMEREVPFS